MTSPDTPEPDTPEPDTPEAIPPECARAQDSRAEAGAAGNERLTALAGAVLLVLFAVEIVTLIQLRALVPLHFFVGVLLVGPVAVKTASTGWRFVRYYTRNPAYRRKGPPRPLMRILSPLLLVFTVAVIGSGVALAFTGPAPPILLKLHVVSFLGWLGLILLHVAVYLPVVPRLIADDWRERRTARARRSAGSESASRVEGAGRAQGSGRAVRVGANVAALAVAAIPAAFLLPAATVWADWLEQPVTGPGVLALVLVAALVVALAVRRGRRRT